MTSPVLQIESLAIALPPGADRPHAVQDVSLTLHAGKVTCLVGESGSGKSMVARAVMALLPPRVTIDHGALRFGDVDLARLDAARMRVIRGAEIGMVFQEPMTALNPLHRVGQQVDEVLRLHTGWSAPNDTAGCSSCSRRHDCRSPSASTAPIPTSSPADSANA